MSLEKNATYVPVSRRRWTEEEDANLIAAVEANGPGGWNRISLMMTANGYLRKDWQCRERWQNHLKPGINKDEWSKEEDEVLLREIDRVGRDWRTIASFLPGRAGSAVKNRFHRIMKHDKRRRPRATPVHVPTAPAVKPDAPLAPRAVSSAKAHCAASAAQSVDFPVQSSEPAVSNAGFVKAIPLVHAAPLSQRAAAPAAPAHLQYLPGAAQPLQPHGQLARRQGQAAASDMTAVSYPALDSVIGEQDILSAFSNELFNTPPLDSSKMHAPPPLADGIMDGELMTATFNLNAEQAESLPSDVNSDSAEAALASAMRTLYNDLALEHMLTKILSARAGSDPYAPRSMTGGKSDDIMMMGDGMGASAAPSREASSRMLCRASHAAPRATQQYW